MGSLIAIVAIFGQYCSLLIDVSDMLIGSNNNSDKRDLVDIILSFMQEVTASQ